jgi:hypothetical protein
LVPVVNAKCEKGKNKRNKTDQFSGSFFHLADVPINGLRFLIAGHTPIDLIEYGRLQGLVFALLGLQTVQGIALALGQQLRLPYQRLKLFLPRSDDGLEMTVALLV